MSTSEEIVRRDIPVEKEGWRNIYRCDLCGYDTMTVNLSDGVTPMFIRCKKGLNFGETQCEGTARSFLYRVHPNNVLPKYGWYSPTDFQRRNLDQNMLNHVENGGLLLRKLDNLELEKLGILKWRF